MLVACHFRTSDRGCSEWGRSVSRGQGTSGASHGNQWDGVGDGSGSFGVQEGTIGARTVPRVFDER